MKTPKIPFNKPFISGEEITYIKDAVNIGKISGNGLYTKKCHAYFEKNLEINKALLTTSCTDALEMSALLANVKKGDEVIVPSYTFVSTALAFVREGAEIVFADSREDHPGIDENSVEALITQKTKVIVVVHYAGVACDMDKIMAIANKHNIIVVEDAAQAIDSYYKGKPLGSIGDLSAFSFHETKNIISGEGGLLGINNKKFINRSEIIWEKGTNRTAFFKGEVDKYGWVDTGSSFLPSEITAAFLYGQLENLKLIQDKRKLLWDTYYKTLKELQVNHHLRLPLIPNYATNNAHMFYVVTDNIELRDRLIKFLRKKGIHAVFHYLSLETSPFYSKINKTQKSPNSQMYTECLLRLPLYYQLSVEEVIYIATTISDFYSDCK